MLSATEKSAIRQGYHRVRAADSRSGNNGEDPNCNTVYINPNDKKITTAYRTPKTFSALNDYSLNGIPCIDPETLCADDVSKKDCKAFFEKCANSNPMEYYDDNCFKAWSNVLSEDGKVCLTKYKIDQARLTCSPTDTKQKTFYP